jgi:hypothetical protein
VNMIEALREISAEGARWVWARPVSWRGLGKAICFKAPNDWNLVPTARGGIEALLPRPKDCLGEWEVIEPKVVNQELP